jgi:hypothetical protein
MKTVFIIIFFILLYGAMTRIIGITVLNIVGLPGLLIGYKTTRRTDIRYIVGLIVSIAGQVYAYFAFMIYIINWTRTQVDPESFTKYIIWFFCAGSAIGAIQQIYDQAKRESIEHPTGYENPQIQALQFTVIISFVGFFIIVFYPEITEPLWAWVNRIGFPI